MTTDPTAIEHHCADAWPVLVERRLGDWRMRAAGGFTGRANSTLVTGHPGKPLVAALHTVIGFAAEHAIAAKLHVVLGDPVQDALPAAGWCPDSGHSGEHGVLVLTGPLADAPRRGAVHTEPPPGWWPLTVGTGLPTPAQRHVLATGDVGFGAVLRNGTAVAAVRGRVSGPYLHIARLAVDPALRGTGLARGLLATLGDWAATRGATRCVLQVLATNAAAVGLYRSLGCRENHRYQYWVPACGRVASQRVPARTARVRPERSPR